jgi:hypothetical protein
MYIILMVSKYELLTDEEIKTQYILNKQKERARNKEAYERLKLNKIKYRKRLSDAYNNQVERLQRIKEDEEKYKIWLFNNKIIQSKSYYKRIINEMELKMKLMNIENEKINN